MNVINFSVMMLCIEKTHIFHLLVASIPREVSRKFRKYADKAGPKNVKLHEMRQTPAMFMLLEEVLLK